MGHVCKGVRATTAAAWILRSNTEKLGGEVAVEQLAAQIVRRAAELGYSKKEIEEFRVEFNTLPTRIVSPDQEPCATERSFGTSLGLSFLAQTLGQREAWEVTGRPLQRPPEVDAVEAYMTGEYDPVGDLNMTLFGRDVPATFLLVDGKLQVAVWEHEAFATTPPARDQLAALLPKVGLTLLSVRSL